jgi:hypothetical protein
MDRKIIAGIAIVLVLFVMGVMVFFPLQPEQVKQKAPNININSYTYSVSVDKPEIQLQATESQTATDQKTSSELTVYNDNLALVKDMRQISLEKGLNLVKYKDISALIDPTSVLFRDLTYPSTYVLEQNYEYDLVSKSKILEKYLEKEITVQVVEGTISAEYTGKLLSYTDGIVLDTSDGIITLNNPSRISFPELPDGLLTKPTLVWKVWTEDAGSHETQTVYLTQGLSWRADYVMSLSSDDKQMDFSGWTTITNNSGTAYPDTKLKLVAGEVHRVQEGPVYKDLYERGVAMGSIAPEAFSEQPIFEYHLYSLDRKTNVNNNETKQISLLNAEKIPVEKEFVYDGAVNNDKVQVKMKFENSEKEGMGMPLPKGVVRVYKQDSDGQLQFLGEDSIDHTQKDEKVEIAVGYAFDIKGERIQTEYTSIAKGVTRQSYKITLKNHKTEAVKVVVKENVGSGSKVTTSSDPFEQKSASEIEFTVDVPANGEKTVTYTFENRYFY